MQPPSRNEINKLRPMKNIEVNRTLWLLVPAVLLLTALFLLPAVILLSYSVMTQDAAGNIGAPATFEHFVRLFTNPLYAKVLVVTLRVSLVTCLLAIVIGFPCALVIVRGHPLMARITTMVIIAPLVVSIIVRTYGWQLILANGNNGVVNWVLSQLGFGRAALRILYTESAVVIGSLHVFLPMFVLPLTSSLVRISPALEEAAATLGASAWKVFLRITLPLCIPGMIAGCTLVFALTFGSFVTPVLLGGNKALMLGTVLEQQVVAAYDWPFAAAIAVVMVLVVFAVNLLLFYFSERRAPISAGAA